CLDCYQAAAELGSGEALHATAMFYFSGGVVAQDLKEGAQRFRSAAEKGYGPSKVFVANLYELGIQYKEDKEKADTWYRSVARGEGVKDDAGSPEYARAMAELGCVRYCLALISEEGTSAEDKEAFLAKAKAHGYQQ